MIKGTLHLSERMVAVIGNDMPELLKSIEGVILQKMESRSNISATDVELAGADARLELFDVASLSGLTIDTTAAYIKVAISSFVGKKGLAVDPFDVSVLSHAEVES